MCLHIYANIIVYEDEDINVVNLGVGMEVCRWCWAEGLYALILQPCEVSLFTPISSVHLSGNAH